MNTLEIGLAIVSLGSFGLAVFSFVRMEIKKANEKANIEIMRERLKSLYQGLASLFHSADAIVQIPKAREGVSVNELQDLARVVRGQVYFQLERIKRSRMALDQWKFGELIGSGQLDEGVAAPEDGMQGDNEESDE